MTFEEFFIKKKIDLEQFAKAEPDLYAEFKSHFSLMGEKSFDHTKKFWFNKLRRLYHLVTPEKAVTQTENKVASQAEPLESPTIDQKPANAETGEITTPGIKRPAFKPRNIPSKDMASAPGQSSDKADSAAVKDTNKPAEDAKTVDSLPGQTVGPESPAGKPLTTEENPKPAYKPRFNPKNLPQQKPAEPVAEKTEEPKAEENTAEQAAAPAVENTAPKPAYKPRFNPKNIPQQKPAEPVAEKTEEPKAEKNTTEQTAAPAEENPAPKPAYKPRFNPKNIPQQKPAEPVAEKTEEPKAEENTTEQTAAPAEENPAPKPAYKPRFNMKNIKPKSEE